MEDNEEERYKKLSVLLKREPLTTEEIEGEKIDSGRKSYLDIAYKYDDVHIAALRDQTVFYLEGEKDSAIKKLMELERNGIITDRDLQIYNVTEDLLRQYEIHDDVSDRLRAKTIENYLLYKRKNDKRMNTISRDKVREIVKGSFLLATKMLYLPVPRTRSAPYKEVLSTIGGSLPSRPSFHINGLVKKVGEELQLSEEETEKLKQRVQSIAEKFEGNALRYVGKNDLAIAGAYIYVALKQSDDLPDITQRVIGELAGTTVPTIVDHVRDIRGVLERYDLIN